MFPIKKKTQFFRIQINWEGGDYEHNLTNYWIGSSSVIHVPKQIKPPHREEFWRIRRFSNTSIKTWFPLHPEFRRFRVSESLGYSLNSSITAKLMKNYMKFTKVLHLHQNTNKCNCKCRNLLINTVGKFAFGQLWYR